MIKTETIQTGYINTNTYVIYGTQGAVVIDPGAEYGKIVKRLNELNTVCRYILLTHGHFDHINAVAQMQADGAKVYIHCLDAHMTQKSLSAGLGIRVKTFAPDILLNGGERLNFCGAEFEAIHTPGHTAGSVCYLSGGVIYSGDTLFKADIGRTDLPTGDEDALLNSIKNKLFKLEKDFRVLPGHGEETSLFWEKANNPYV